MGSSHFKNKKIPRRRTKQREKRRRGDIKKNDDEMRAHDEHAFTRSSLFNTTKVFVIKRYIQLKV